MERSATFHLWVHISVPLEFAALWFLWCFLWIFVTEDKKNEFTGTTAYCVIQLCIFKNTVLPLYLWRTDLKSRSRLLFANKIFRVFLKCHKVIAVLIPQISPGPFLPHCFQLLLWRGGRLAIKVLKRSKMINMATGEEETKYLLTPDKAQWIARCILSLSVTINIPAFWSHSVLCASYNLHNK